jgi:apolipoprotein N-acyltransferase
VVGASREDQDNWYNTAVILGGDGQIEAQYDKHHLVPFGEYLPFPTVFERFGLQALAQNAGRFSAGTGPQAIQTGDIPEFQLLICYEAIFSAEILRGDARPDWLLHLTNDAWFGDFSGPFQHLAQARVRAVEFGLPLGRAANTGVSAMIDPFGRVTAQLGLNKDGFVDAKLPRALPPTVYARFGYLPIIGAIVLLILAGVALERRKLANWSDSA